MRQPLFGGSPEFHAHLMWSWIDLPRNTQAIERARLLAAKLPQFYCMHEGIIKMSLWMDIHPEERDTLMLSIERWVLSGEGDEPDAPY